MAIDELVDDEAFKQEKLFDEKEYSTLIINREGFTSKQNSAADLVEQLLDGKNERRETEEIYARLKEAKAAGIMVQALQSVKKTEQLSKLLAACWESGLDFSAHFLVFVTLACHNEFKVAMEALTVVENCEGVIDDSTLHQALGIASNSKGAHQGLVKDLQANIKQRLG
jgi:hypothetical protein